MKTTAIILMVFVWIEFIIITLSYLIAFFVKKTFGVGSILAYSLASTIVYLMFLIKLISNYLENIDFFENCALFFIIAGSIKFLAGTVLLLSIWLQPKKGGLK
jgi:hypothetical protein